ncbi:MAG: T9SS type A sorting domain-containing protein [Bacteroidales bacterium]
MNDNVLDAKLYPIPAHDFATVSYNLSETLIGLRFVVYDAQGKIIYTKELTKPSDQLMINLKDYAKGNYIAALFNNNKVIKRCKFVVE